VCDDRPVTLAQAWIAAARLRRRVMRARGHAPPREELVAAHARGRSFLDVGCMWGVDGAIAFAAEDAGATSVTGIDVMAPTAAFEQARAERGSGVRFVHGDIHERQTIAAAGVHDVVWCSGVVYHVPHPLLTLERLRELTGETLLLASETLPEVPGIRQACVFLPTLPERDRLRYARVRGRDATQHGLTSDFDPRLGYGNWYWGLTGSALVAMVRAAGFEPLEVIGDPFHVTLVARAALSSSGDGHDTPNAG
jgi:SAM-dependent methyltransferase